MKTKAQRSKTSKNKSAAEAGMETGSGVSAADPGRSGKAAIQKTPKVPVKKTGEKKAGGGGSSRGLFSKSVQFLREAKGELKKVKWPTRKELLASTSVVIVLSLLVAFYLGLIDFGLIKIIRLVVG